MISKEIELVSTSVSNLLSFSIERIQNSTTLVIFPLIKNTIIKDFLPQSV